MNYSHKACEERASCLHCHVVYVAQFLRKVAQEKELEAVAGGAGTTVTLLSLLASMSW